MKTRIIKGISKPNPPPMQSNNGGRALGGKEIPSQTSANEPMITMHTQIVENGVVTNLTHRIPSSSVPTRGLTRAAQQELVRLAHQQEARREQQIALQRRELTLRPSLEPIPETLLRSCQFCRHWTFDTGTAGTITDGWGGPLNYGICAIRETDPYLNNLMGGWGVHDCFEPAQVGVRSLIYRGVMRTIQPIYEDIDFEHNDSPTIKTPVLITPDKNDDICSQIVDRILAPYVQWVPRITWVFIILYMVYAYLF